MVDWGNKVQSATSFEGKRQISSAAKITLIYFVVGVFWISFSDSFILFFVGNDPAGVERLSQLQTYKGWFFVAFTSVLLCLLIYSSLIKQQDYLSKISNLEIRHSETLVNIPLGIYQTDDQGYMIYLNHKAKVLLEDDGSLDPVSHNKRSSLKLANNQKATWESAFKNRFIFYEQYEINIPGSDSITYVIDHAFPLFDETGKFLGYMGTLTDTTELKKIREHASDIESKLLLAVQSTGLGLWHWNLKTDAIYFSPEWKMQIGYKDDELANTNEEFDNRLHPDEVESTRQKITEYLTNPAGHYHNEFRLRHKDGTYRWIYSHAIMQFDEYGKPSQLLGTHTDITPIKQHEQEFRESQQRLHHLLDASPTVLYTLEKQTGGQLVPTFASNNVERIFGFTIAEALQSDWWYSHVHPEDRAQALENFRALKTNGTMDSRYRFYDKQGKVHWIRDFSRLNSYTKNKQVNQEVIGLFTDVTREHESAETQKILKTAFANMVDGALITDSSGNILFCNPAFEEIFSYPEQDIKNRNITLFETDSQKTNFYNDLIEEMKGRDNWKGHVWAISKEGMRIPSWLTINTIRDQNNKTTKLIFIYKDMSVINEKEAELSRLAHYDQLTELPNLVLFKTQLTNAIRQAKRQQSKLALLHLGLDNFRSINDSLGRDAGDELLVSFTRFLEKKIGNTDILARVGGDDFIILIEVRKMYKEAMKFSQLILEALDMPFQIGTSEQVYLSANIGISLYPNNGQNAEQLIQRGNLAMSHASTVERNFISLYSEEMEAKASNKLKLLTSLREALDKKQFVVHYQPKYEINPKHYTGAEALLRWRNAEGELVPPGKFIPLAEASGLITRIGVQVLDMVSRQIRQWLDQGLDPGIISVNVSVRQFRDPDLVKHFHTAIKSNDIPAKYLAIEITESALMTDSIQVKSTIKALQDLGLKIYLDDFGTGFSSFSYLSSFDLDFLKIDMSFIRHLHRSEKDNQIVLSMLNLSRNLGMHTVAEGVENEEQLAFLADNGCNEIQGYYFSPPLETGEFEALVLKSSVHKEMMNG